MRKKYIKTRSGAYYIVYEDGTVKRPHFSEETPMIFGTVRDYQYIEGFLNAEDAKQAFGELVVGGRIRWMGVVNDAAEPITSSVIDDIVTADLS